MNSPALKQTPAPADPLATALAAVGSPSKRPTPPLQQKRFQTLSYSSRDWGNTHGVTVPTGTPFEDVLQPGYWALVAPSLLNGDWIRVLTDDGSYEALLSVRAVSGPGSGRQNNRAVVAKLEFWTFDPVVDPAMKPVSHRIEYKGTHLKWAIIRNADHEPVKDGFGSEDEARSALTALLRVQK